MCDNFENTMPIAVQPPDSIEEDEELFEDEEEMRRCLSKLCYGDLYIIGRIWIGALKNALVGAKFSLIPVVKAAKPEANPERPPPMKYNDLPIYKTPHYDYKDYVEKCKICPNANVKLLHTYLYPKVRCYRKNMKESITGMKCELVEMKNDICSACCKKKNEFKCFMRHPDNLILRQAVVALGGLTGFYLGGGGSFPKRLFYTSFGALAAGALCFPKETDEVFRTAVYHAGKGGIGIYNAFCGRNFSLRERIPCKDDLPPPPKPKKVTPCPEKK